MPDKKYLIEIPDMPDGSGVWDADKWERNKDAFMADYPNAQVFELGEYDEADSQESDQILLSFEDEASSDIWDQAKWERNKYAFTKDNPEAQVSRVRYVDYWGQKAEANRAEKAALQQPDEERNAKLAELGYYDDLSEGQLDFDLAAPSMVWLKPLSSAISSNSVSGMTEYLDPRVQEFFANDTAYTDKMAEIARLDAEYEQNPSVIAQREWEAKMLEERKAYAGKLEKEIRANMDADVDMRKAARGGAAKRGFDPMESEQMSYLLDRVAGDEAGSGAAENEKLENYNTALKFMEKAKIARDVAGKGFGGAVGDWAKEGVMDLATQDDVEAYNEIGNILSRLEKELGNLKSENLTEEVFDKYLTKDEQALIKSFYEYNAAMAEAGENMSRAYKGGKIFAESVPFMLEFLITGGIYKGAGRAATKGLETALVKWVSKAARNTASRTARKIAAATARDLTYALVGTTARTLASPGTYERMAEASVEIEDGHLNRAKNAAIAAADIYVENLSEISGGLIGKTLGWAGKGVGKLIAKTPLSKVGGMLADNKLMQSISAFMPKLETLGFHGLPEEIGEEFIGNAIREVLNIQPGALKEMVSDDNFGAMLIGFAPMTLIGAAGGAISLGAINYEAAKLGNKMREMMSDHYSAEEMDAMMSIVQNAGTAEEIQQAIKPMALAIANAAERGMLTQEQAAEEIEMLYQWGGFMAQNNALLFSKRAQDNELANAKRAEMADRYGRFWQEDETESVQVATLNNGSTVFVTSAPAEDGKITTIDIQTGKKGFANISDIASTEVEGEQIQSSNKMTMAAFLNGQIAMGRKTAEETRMNNERNAQIQALAAQIIRGTRINLGTEGSPVIVYAIGTNKNGVVVVDETGMESTLGWEQAAYALGQPIKVETDQQKLDAEISERLQRMAERRMQRAVTPATQATAEAAEEAAEVVAQEQQNIPLNEDGTVNEALFWTQDPEGYVKWNDEQNKDGGQDSLKQIAISKQELFGMLNEAATGQNTSNPTMRKAAEKQVAAIADKIARLEALEMSYADALAEEKEAVKQTQATPTATMSEEQLEQMDTQYQGILGKTRIQSERVRVMQEYLNKLAENSAPIRVLTKDNYEEVMRAEGCPEDDIKRVGKALNRKRGGQVAGFASNGVTFVMANTIADINSARITYIHERQHLLNSQNPEVVKQFAAALGDKENALRILETFVDKNGLEEYKNDSIEKLADEIICRSMEIVYSTENYSVDLQNQGLSEEAINIINTVDNGQRTDKSLSSARRSSYVNGSRRENIEENGRNSEQVSGGILGEQEAGSLGSGGRGDGLRGQGSTRAEVISEEQLSAPNSGTAQQITAADGEVLADTDGKGGVRFSIRTWNEGGRDYLAAWLANDTTLTEEEKADILARMDEFYKNALLYSNTYAPFGTWSDAGVRYDNNGNPLMSVIKANGDYAMNLDFSLVCKKRRPLNRLLRILVNRNAFASYTLKERELAEINWILQEHGFEVACALCFVDSKRYRVTGVADVFAALYNRLVKSLAPEGVQIAHFNYNENPNVEVVENGLDTMSDDQLNWDRFDRMLSAYKPGSVEHKVAQYLREHPEARKLVDATDFIEAEGFESVKENNPDLLKFYNMKKGTGGPKASFGDVQYLNDILKKEKSFDAEKAYAVGGVRLQSFSDFVPHMYFDYMQLFAELAAKKLPLHAYTKEVLFAKIFGLTGAKINMSLVPAVVEGGVAPGLDAEGNYAWADPVTDAEGNVIQQGQSFPYDEAMAIQQAEGYSKNCGVIAVGVSDAHIEKMLDDPNIPFIIPYHKSSLNAIVARMTNIDQYKDYTNVQNTRKASGSKLDKGTKDFNFNEYLHGLGESGTPQQAAQAYLDWCRENNYKPKFSQFAYHPNYYKLLQDFNTIDLATGEYAPQGAVTMTFPTEGSAFGNVETLIQQGLQEDTELEEKMEQEIDGIADQVLARLEEISKEPKMSEKQQAKKMAELADERMAKIKEQSGAIDLVEEAKKADLRHRMSSENTLVPGHKKGQPMLSDAEMMADVSFRITKNTKATIEKWFNKAGVDAEMTEATINYLDYAFEDTTEQLCAAKWYLNGKINLPDEDEYKVRDAVKAAKQNKVDALSYASPMDVLNTFGQPKSKVKPIDPDTVKEFSNKKELAEGIVVYDVQDDFEGQAAVRKIIDTHWGEDANPWCLAARTNGDLERAKDKWLHYSKYPKRIAFRNGKLLAFYASANDKTWWDRNDDPHTNIPYSVKSKEGEYEVSTNYELKEGNKKAKKVSVGKSDKKGRTAYFVGNRLESAGIQDGERNLFYSSFPAGATLSDSTYGIGRSIEIQYDPYKNVTQISFERRTKDEPTYYVRVGYGNNGVRAISFVEGTRSWDIRYGINGDQIFVGRAQLNFDLTNELSNVYYGAYHMYRINDEEYEIARGRKKVGIVKKGEKVTMQMLEAFGEDGAPAGALLDFINDMGWNRSDYPYPNPMDADLLRRDDEVREQIRKVENEINEIAGGRYLSSVPAIRFRVTAEQDKAYMDAVEAGDMEAAQGMVYNAARAAGYNSPRLYHGTDAEFTTFDKEFNDPGSEGFFFTNSEEMAASYGDNIKQVYLRVEDPYVIEGNGRNWNQLHTDIFSIIPEIEDQIRVHEIAMKSFLDRGRITQEQYDHFRKKYYDKVDFIKDESKDSIFDVIKKYIYRWQIRNFKSMLNVERTRDFEWFLQQLDSDVNIIFKDITDYGPNSADFYIARDVAHDVYVTTNPKNIKSADAVTYDDEGKVIPLSERFNPESSDIRFRVANDNQAIFVSNAVKAVEGIKQEKATPEQWLKMIEKNGGLKAGEDKWMGLSDFLKSSDKKTLTKQEVLDFVNENMIIIEEQHYGNIDEEAAKERLFKENASDVVDGKSLEELQKILDDHAESASRYDEEAENDDFTLDSWLTEIMLDEFGDDFTMFYQIEDGYIDYLEMDWWERDADAETLEDENGVRSIHSMRESYTTRGLTNSHEIALTVPTIERWNTSDELHFGDAGDGRAVAWIRFGETYSENTNSDVNEYLKEKYSKEDFEAGNFTEEDWDKLRAARKAGKKVLVIDEIQSKRHQEGREKGYLSKDAIEYRKNARNRAKKASNALYDYIGELVSKYPGTEYSLERVRENRGRFTEEENNKLTLLIMEYNNAELDLEKSRNEGVPDAPFDKNWHELAMKRMLRYAAENGYDFIAWTKGDQQAKRYDLSRDVKKISTSKANKDGERIINIYYRDEYNDFKNLVVDKDGKVFYGDFFGSNLADVVGKEMALQIMNAEDATEFSGEGLMIGGEGMRGFYDKMLPSFMNKYGKKWGIKVEDINLPNLGKSGYTMHSVPVTEEMKASVMEGQVMFRTIPITQEVQDEMDAISATAIVRGNYLKAPNGADTNLTPEQWAMVRTKAFKAWFGDWEKAARIQKLRNSEDASIAGDEIAPAESIDKKTALEYGKKLQGFYTNKDTGASIQLQRGRNNGGVNEVLQHNYKDAEHLQSIAAIPQIIEKSIFIESVPNADIEKNPDVVEYQHFVCGLKIGGEDYTVHSLVAVDKKGDRYYDHNLTAIEKKKLLDLIESQAVEGEDFGTTPGTQPTILSTYKGKQLVSLLQVDASKVVDANGEPKVVFHGSNWRPILEEPGKAIFKMRSGLMGRGAYFTDNFTNAADYAREKYEWENYKEVDEDFVSDNGYVTEAFLNIRNEDNIREYYGETYYLATDPNQIKSATDNTGEFSTEDKDIRYRVMSDVNTNPTEAQKKAGNYKMGHIRLDGYNITIENPKGSVRRGTDSKGNAWENTLNNDYGYIRGTEGVDGDHIDVYLSDNPTEGNVFVIDQVNPETREFDEHKVMYGFNSAEEAREAYLANFSEGWNGLGAITEVSKDEFKKWIESSHRKTKPFSEYKSVRANEMQSTDESELRYRVVSNQETLDRLNSEPTIKVYRAMQLIDGKLYPPMSAKVDGELRQPIELGQWEEAEERPDLVDEKGRFKLDKGNKSSLKARYNPYFHTSPTPLNDQFSSAQTRPELVTVEVEVPESELTSGYKAEKAKDSVGKMEWKAGVVQSKLSGTRTVILSRWDKPVRIVPDSEVADVIVDMFEGKDITMPSNVVTPSLRAELEKRGVPFVETDNQGNPVEEISFRVTGTPTDEVVTNGLQLTPAQTAEVAANIFAALPEESRKKITEGLNGNILGLKDAILQIPTSLASKENWNEEDKQMAAVVRDVIQGLVDANPTSRPLTTKEALWMLYDSTNTVKDLVDAASRAFVAHNLGFDSVSMQRKQEVNDYLRFRTASNGAIDAATDMYNYETSLWTERLKESWLDMNQSVVSLQKAMAEASGMPIEPWENLEYALNRLSSKSYADKKKYLRDFLMPMWDTILDIVKHDHVSIEEIERYMMLKHGLERNKKFASRDAKEFYRAMYDLVAERMKNQSHAQQVVALSEAKKRLADIDAQIAVASSSQLPRLNEARAKAQYDVDVADLVLRGDEQQNEAELQAYYDAVDNEVDPKYREFREKDYGGLTSMFVDTTDVKRSDYKSEEAYQKAVLAATTPRYDDVAAMESAAEREVSLFENKVYMHRALWDKVNAATKETLRHQYENGMITLEQYEAVRDMFEFYVPLRGFADNTAEDMYSYYMNNSAGGFTKPILGAKGRKTRAESPLGWIGTMAESAIQSDNKNQAKMCLYYMTLRRPDQNLLTITETWYEYTGQKDGKKVFKAAYPPATDRALNADELRQHMEDWENDMKQKQSRGEAYKGSQRVDLKGSVIFQDEKEEKEHIVRVKVAGKDYSILINGNPRAAQAINGLLNPDANVGPVAQWIGNARRNLSALLTSYSPLFWVSNFQRDLLSSTMRVSEADGWDVAMKYLANRRKAWRVASYIYKYDAGTLGDSYYEKLYKEFAENGGTTGYTSLTTNKEYENLLEKYAKNVDKHVLNALKGIWDKFMGFGEAIEQVSRFAAFITAREDGKSIEEAINAAKEVSVNFNRKGSAKAISLDELDKLRTKDGKKLNKAQRIAALALSAMPGPMKFCYYFVNASIQSLSSSAKLAKKSPGKAATWVGMYMGTSIALAMLNYLLSDDDDDEYLNLPDYLRHSTALVKIADGYYFKWSIPQEMRPFYAWADILVRKMMGKMPHKSGKEVGKEMALAASQWLPVNPFDAEDPLLSIIPDFLSPLAEIMANTNAFGGKIYDDMTFKPEGVVKKIPAYRKATEKTGDIYVDISEFLNDVSGGDEATKGQININPAIMEHLIEGYGGGLYDFAKMMVSIPSMILSDDPVQVKEIPFVNKVILSVDETNMYSHTNEAFRHYKDVADNAKRVEKEYRQSDDPSRADAYREEEDWRIYLLYKEYEKDFKDVKERLDNAVDKEEEKLLKQEQNVLREMFLDDISKGDIPEVTFQIREDVKRIDKEVKAVMKPVTEANKERLERRNAGDVDGMLEAIERRDSLKETPEYKRAEELNKDLKKIKQQLKELGLVTRGSQRDSVIGELQMNYDALIQKMEQL